MWERRRSLRTVRFGFPAALLVGIWVLGLVAVAAVVVFETRADETRRAQVEIAKMRNEQGALLSIAFRPGTSPTPVPAQETARDLARAKRGYEASVAQLVSFGHSDVPARIQVASTRYFQLVDRLTVLIAGGKLTQAARLLGSAEQPVGVQGRLQAEFDRADLSYGAGAERSREVASVGTVVAIVSLLLAFSVTFHHLMRARRRSHADATTDALTGLGNRRKLFADMDQPAGVLERSSTLAAIFDLDGFKAYNDTFGHPAGDALLARLGSKLAHAVGARGQAYRVGGDEFVVTTSSSDGEQILTAAQTALSEKGAGFAIGCSRGSTRLRAGRSFEDALHVADQRLYANKRSSRGGDPSGDAKDALLQVLAEQNTQLVTHLGHVAELAASTAVTLGLAPADVSLTRLAAELHDIGKAAIPASILDKPGPLDAAERWFMQRHSEIGERIVAAAPTLKAIAPIVRAAHERPDGLGYPDGLNVEEIPIASRIIAVVDAFDAMTSDRAYQAAMTSADALKELRRNAGTQFDGIVIEAFATTLAHRHAVPLVA